MNQNYYFQSQVSLSNEHANSQAYSNYCLKHPGFEKILKLLQKFKCQSICQLMNIKAIEKINITAKFGSKLFTVPNL